jgi:hypothetical protein
MRPLGRLRCRWENSIKIHCKELHGIHLTENWNQWEALVATLVNPQIL